MGEELFQGAVLLARYCTSWVDDFAEVCKFVHTARDFSDICAWFIAHLFREIPNSPATGCAIRRLNWGHRRKL